MELPPAEFRDARRRCLHLPRGARAWRLHRIRQTYPAGGVAQGEEVLADLARHPATARHISWKSAAHFIADDPPDVAVCRLENAFHASDGDLAVVAQAVLDAPAARDPSSESEDALRVRAEHGPAPADLLDDQMLLQQAFNALGQRLFEPPSPKGWPDEAAAWLAPHSFKERLDWATLVSERHPPTENPVEIADAAFGEFLSKETRQEIARADTAAQGLTILLMSPEFSAGEPHEVSAPHPSPSPSGKYRVRSPGHAAPLRIGR